jgi:hypothetical protein
MHPFAIQDGSRKSRDQGGKAFALLEKRIQQYGGVSLLIPLFTDHGILVIAGQHWSVLLPDALHTQRPPGHLVDHMSRHLYRRPLKRCRAMPQYAFIGRECSAKGERNLAKLCGPSGLFSFHSCSLPEE